MTRRVVVTGLGMLSPLGIGVDANWDAVCQGKSGIDYITRFNAQDFPVRIAGEVQGFDPADHIEPKEIKKMDTFIHYAVACCRFALKDSGFEITEANADRVGTLIGVGLGGLPAIEKYHEVYQNKGVRKITPFFIPMLIPNMASGQISIIFGTRGPNTCVVTACASGTHAIGDAYKMIRDGVVDAMIAGGSESVITPLAIGGFAAAKALSTRNDDPKGASRPFDKDRDGFVMGEGCGVLILEEMESAKKRGARIYAEVAGYALNSDAFHMTAPSKDGEGAARCMQLALDDAKMNPEEVDYINAHGTSTGADFTETTAIKSVFKDHARKLQISSTKSMTGHLLGAAGGVEAIFSVLAMHHGVIPPTINYTTPDPDCDLDYVPNEARQAKVRAALSNSFGFGGTNGVVIFKQPTD
ncbi:beta-ketoacyl-ACP synthase II [Nitrospina gracilis]|uniref:beta-ketoacyl-ACP synthase II n=1 Tax=Nitrospina gracilis TaxID=35801 RepID=UPI0023518295|nr:beta-ketoacyl-ACP synthase II [Nitrospina gracilis]